MCSNEAHVADGIAARDALLYQSSPWPYASILLYQMHCWWKLPGGTFARKSRNSQFGHQFPKYSSKSSILDSIRHLNTRLYLLVCIYISWVGNKKTNVFTLNYVNCVWATDHNIKLTISILIDRCIFVCIQSRLYCLHCKWPGEHIPTHNCSVFI